MTRIKGFFFGLAAGIMLGIILIPMWFIGTFILLSEEVFLFIFAIIFAPIFTAIIGYVWGGIVQDKEKKIAQKSVSQEVVKNV